MKPREAYKTINHLRNKQRELLVETNHICYGDYSGEINAGDIDDEDRGCDECPLESRCIKKTIGQLRANLENIQRGAIRLTCFGEYSCSDSHNCSFKKDCIEESEDRDIERNLHEEEANGGEKVWKI